MRVAVFSESAIDDQIGMRLVEGIYGKSLVREELQGLRVRGVNALFRTLESVVKRLHYRSFADALVVIADSDNCDVHDATHDGSQQRCRHCRLEREISRIKRELRRVEGRPPFEIALVVATPSIEAWLVDGGSNCRSETAWRQARSRGVDAVSEIKQMKELAYGSTGLRNSPIRLARGLEHVEQLLERIDVVRAAFPDSFGRFVEAVRSWPK
jgi:hypothetical protein